MNALLLVVFLLGIALGVGGAILYTKLTSATGTIVLNMSDPMKEVYSLEMDDLADLERYKQVIFKISQR